MVYVTVCRLQRAVSRWQEVVRRRLSQREQAADNLHHRMLKRRAWQGWREVHVSWYLRGVNMYLGNIEVASIFRG